MESLSSTLRKLSPFQWILIAGGAIVLVLLIVVLGGNPDPAAESGTGHLSQTPFVVLAVLAFVAGMLGFVSPCTLPLLPAYFAITFQSKRKQVLLMTVAFMAGLASTFAVFGALAGIIGQSLSGLGISRFDLAEFGGWIVLFFGIMSLLGKGFAGLQSKSQREASLWGSFVFGATFGVGFTSCTGPILGAITTLSINANFKVLQGELAQLAPILGSMLLLVIFAMGLGVPLILVSTFFGRADRNSLFWRILRGKGWSVTLGGQTLFLHTTNIISGVLFILLGILMIRGQLTLLNNLVPEDLALNIADFFASIEDWLVAKFGG